MVNRFGLQGKIMNAQEGTIIDRYKLHGIDLLAGELRIDLSAPMGIPITAVNELTGEQKHYMLRVTSKGTLCIV